MKKPNLMIFVVIVCVIAITGYSLAESKGKKNGKTALGTDPRYDAAQSIMSNVRQVAKVYEEGGTLVVEFKEYLFPYDINKRLRFITAVADADAVIKGKARLILFFNPGGKKIGKASPIGGVSLED